MTNEPLATRGAAELEGGEAMTTPECATIAKEHQQSKQLEQCCLDNGYCCLDEHDLDGDGNRREMLGACGDVTCQ